MSSVKLLSALFLTSVLIQTPLSAADQKPITLKLWDGDPPGFVKDAGPETTFPQWPGTLGNVSVPSMAVYLPPREKATGAALIYCSGGSYNKVSAVPDEVGNAAHFVPKGVAVIVVKYRTSPPSPDYSAALNDARRAVRIVRHHAKEWNIDPNKVGMIGGSAGGHLILSVATHWDRGDKEADDPIERQSCRPDFVTALCPWHGRQTAAEFPIDKETPPALLCSARDDLVAPIEFAEGIVAAFDKAGAHAKLWTVDTGGHNAFSNITTATGAGWIDQFWLFLKNEGIAGKGE